MILRLPTFAERLIIRGIFGTRFDEGRMPKTDSRSMANTEDRVNTLYWCVERDVNPRVLLQKEKYRIYSFQRKGPVRMKN